MPDIIISRSVTPTPPDDFFTVPDADNYNLDELLGPLNA